MATSDIKNKIVKSLENMDPEHLQSAYGIIKEFANQQKHSDLKVDIDELEEKIGRGIKQLNNDEGSSFELFLKALNSKYAARK